MSRQLLLDREPSAAVALLEKYLANSDALGTRRGMVRRWLGDALRVAGDVDAAQAAYANARGELQSELARQPENPVLIAELAIVQARLGARDDAQKLIRSCSEIAARARRDGFIAECVLAKVQVTLALHSAAEVIGLLGEAMTLRGEFPPLTPALLRVDPEWDSLRDRADFHRLL
jgi:hypothetical protein